MSDADRDLLSLAFTYEDGVLRSPGACRVKLTSVQKRYLVKIELPTGGSSLLFDIEKRRLKIAFNKTRRWP
jgi:hypothetical protein